MSAALLWLVILVVVAAGCSDAGLGDTPAGACRIEDRGVTVRELPAVVTIEADTATTVLLAGPVEGDAGVWMLPCVVDRANGRWVAVSFALSRMRLRGDAVLTLDRVIEVDRSVLGDDLPMTVLAGQVDSGAASVEVLLPDGSTATSAAEDGYFLATWPGTEDFREVRALDAAGALLAGSVEDHTKE